MKVCNLSRFPRFKTITSGNLCMVKVKGKINLIHIPCRKNHYFATSRQPKTYPVLLNVYATILTEFNLSCEKFNTFKNTSYYESGLSLFFGTLLNINSDPRKFLIKNMFESRTKKLGHYYRFKMLNMFLWRAYDFCNPQQTPSNLLNKKQLESNNLGEMKYKTILLK